MLNIINKKQYCIINIFCVLFKSIDITHLYSFKWTSLIEFANIMDKCWMLCDTLIRLMHMLK